MDVEIEIRDRSFTEDRNLVVLSETQQGLLAQSTTRQKLLISGQEELNPGTTEL